MIKVKGKFITCQICGHLFKFQSNDERNEFEKKKEPCPSCKGLYCRKPKTERDLFHLQNKYIAVIKKYTRLELIENKEDIKILTKMNEILVSYTFSLICSVFNSYVHTQEKKIYHSKDSASLLIEQYLRPLKCKHKIKDKGVCNYEWYEDSIYIEDYGKIYCPECGEIYIGINSEGERNNGKKIFLVRGSFKGCFITKGRKGLIAQSLFGKQAYSIFDPDGRYKQEVASLDFELLDGSIAQFPDNTKDMLQTIEDEQDLYHTALYLTKFISEIDEYCGSKKENFIRMLGIYYRLTRGKSAANNLFKTYNRFGKEIYKDTMKYLKAELLKLNS